MPCALFFCFYFIKIVKEGFGNIFSSKIGQKRPKKGCLQVTKVLETSNIIQAGLELHPDHVPDLLDVLGGGAGGHEPGLGHEGHVAISGHDQTQCSPDRIGVDFQLHCNGSIGLVGAVRGLDAGVVLGVGLLVHAGKIVFC